MRGRVLSRRALLRQVVGVSALFLVAACSPQATPEPEPDVVESDAGDPIDALAPGSGAVLEINGQDTAVYKDEDGHVTMLDPACPHSGCSVAWNADESRWDCPCHASHFEPTGEFIRGPAGTGLKTVG